MGNTTFESVHVGLKRYQCKDCQRGFRQNSDLKRHYLSVHAKFKPHQCKACRKSFSRQDSLSTHYYVHVGKPYQCEYCEKSFVHKTQLRVHYYVHARVKPYECEACQRSFTRKAMLNKHKLTYRVTTVAKVINDRCTCTDDCRTNSCLNRNLYIECSSENCLRSWCENRYFYSHPPFRLLSVFKTSNGYGLGLRTDLMLPTDTFVVEYSSRRCRAPLKFASNYCMDLGQGWFLDARNTETKAKYINHACEPNCGAWKWTGADNNIHIGIFTNIIVKAGKELTISYNRGSGARSLDGKEKCRCGSTKCRGVIWQ
ncbi:hypothetical protein F4802DRAFT_140445 [Xylaria palmicola]|nr:hypothetical protein F4802DRAFT_140445 [Xylaria palmicola]